MKRSFVQIGILFAAIFLIMLAGTSVNAVSINLENSDCEITGDDSFHLEPVEVMDIGPPPYWVSLQWNSDTYTFEIIDYGTSDGPETLGDILSGQVQKKYLKMNRIPIEMSDADCEATGSDTLKITGVKASGITYRLDLQWNGDTYQFIVSAYGEESGYNGSGDYVVNDTGQVNCYDSNGVKHKCNGEGQDGDYTTITPLFSTLDGVVTDNNTDLMWDQAYYDNTNYKAAEAACESLSLSGYDDWRMPTIKELISIADFSGYIDEDAVVGERPEKPYIFDEFDIEVPELDSLSGTHFNAMMGQTWSSTFRPDKDNSVYFFNFLDGHLKSQSSTNEDSPLMYRCVRGNEYGINDFIKNGNGTVTDKATGLMWQQANDGNQYTWSKALEYCESLDLAGFGDWRLPDVKQLHSILDYTNKDDTIDTSVFNQTVNDDTGPFFWTGTNDEEVPIYAVYICFGPCWNYTLTEDVHGPGAQRSDPKYDNGNLPESIGDQEDLVQANNYVRCVRVETD